MQTIDDKLLFELINIKMAVLPSFVNITINIQLLGKLIVKCLGIFLTRQ